MSGTEAPPAKRPAPPRPMTMLRALLGARTVEQFVVEIPDETNANVWRVIYPDATFLEPSYNLFDDLQVFTSDYRCVELELIFPENYPHAPPFARVVRPRFIPRTGHVTNGGTICTEMLMADKWDPQMSGDALLVALHCTLVDGKGRIDKHRRDPYDYAEAKADRARIARDHGWTVPK